MPTEVNKIRFGKKEILRRVDNVSYSPILVPSPENPQEKDVLINHEQILNRIDQMAIDIVANHKNENLHVLFVLNGSMVFGVHLMEALRKHGMEDAQYDAIRVESYKGKRKSGKFKITAPPKIDVRGRNVLVVEDIIDSGETMSELENELIKKGVHSITTATLLSKPAKRTVPYEADYTGFIIPPLWVEGFGIDTDEWNRDDPDIKIGYERPSSQKQNGMKMLATSLITFAKKRIPNAGTIFKWM